MNFTRNANLLNVLLPKILTSLSWFLFCRGTEEKIASTKWTHCWDSLLLSVVPSFVFLSGRIFVGIGEGESKLINYQIFLFHSRLPDCALQKLLFHCCLWPLFGRHKRKKKQLRLFSYLWADDSFTFRERKKMFLRSVKALAWVKFPLKFCCFWNITEFNKVNILRRA